MRTLAILYLSWFLHIGIYSAIVFVVVIWLNAIKEGQMSGHNGWGNTGRGSAFGPVRSVSTPIYFAGMKPAIAEAAIEVRKIAEEFDMTPEAVVKRMRVDGVLDCNDEAAEQIVRVATL